MTQQRKSLFKDKLDLPKKPEERIVAAVVIPIILYVLFRAERLCAAWELSQWYDMLIKIALQEVIYIFFSAFSLIFIWALFSPKWVEALLDKIFSRLVAYSLIFFFGCGLFLLFLEIQG